MDEIIGLSAQNTATEADETANQYTESDTVDNSECENNSENEVPFLEIECNQEKKGFSREETAKLVQKGIRFEEAYSSIERVAMLKGQSVEEFIKEIETAQDEAYRKELEEKFGGDTDTVEKMMELYNINKEKTIASAKESRRQAAAEAQRSVNVRIAEEFAKMKADFPELTDYASVPAEVKNAALCGMPLEYAYLKYKSSEQRKIDAAKAFEAEAALKSTGSMDTERNTAFYAGTKFLNALWSK